MIYRMLGEYRIQKKDFPRVYNLQYNNRILVLNNNSVQTLQTKYYIKCRRQEAINSVVLILFSS